MKPRTRSFVLLFDLNMGFSVQILGNQYPVLYWEARTVLSLLLGSPAGQRDVSTSLEVPVPTLPSLCPSPESQESLLWLEQLR